MKHEVGEVVQIRSLDWYDKNKDNFGIISKHYGNFTPSMSAFCGRITEIKNISDEYGFKAGYYIKLDDKNYIWQDWMFEPTKEYGGFGVSPQEELDEINKEDDMVNNPSKKTKKKEKSGIEVIDITRHLQFKYGNIVKYAKKKKKKKEKGYTDKEKELEDWKKCKWYIEDKIKSLEEEIKNTH